MPQGLYIQAENVSGVGGKRLERMETGICLGKWTDGYSALLGFLPPSGIIHPNHYEDKRQGKPIRPFTWKKNMKCVCQWSVRKWSFQHLSHKASLRRFPAERIALMKREWKEDTDERGMSLFHDVFFQLQIMWKSEVLRHVGKWERDDKNSRPFVSFKCTKVFASAASVNGRWKHF